MTVLSVVPVLTSLVAVDKCLGQVHVKSQEKGERGKEQSKAWTCTWISRAR